MEAIFAKQNLLRTESLKTHLCLPLKGTGKRPEYMRYYAPSVLWKIDRSARGSSFDVEKVTGHLICLVLTKRYLFYSV